MLFYAERIISSRKCIFDELFQKQVHAFIYMFWLYQVIFEWVDNVLILILGQIIFIYYILMTDILTKENNFIHLTPFICLQTR